jgi:hypothetical protein
LRLGIFGLPLSSYSFLLTCPYEFILSVFSYVLLGQQLVLVRFCA